MSKTYIRRGPLVTMDPGRVDTSSVGTIGRGLRADGDPASGLGDDLHEEPAGSLAFLEHGETCVPNGAQDIVIEPATAADAGPRRCRSSLERTDGAASRPRVLEQPDRAARAQHAACLTEALTGVADRAQDKGRDDGIEGRVGEGQGASVALDEDHAPTVAVGAFRGDRERRRADVDTVDRDTSWVHPEIRTGPDPDLEGVAAGAPGDPRACPTEPGSIGDAHPEIEQARGAEAADLKAR